MPKRKQEPRDFYSDWELWEMDGTLHVQLTGAGWMRAIELGKEAEGSSPRRSSALRPGRDVIAARHKC